MRIYHRVWFRDGGKLNNASLSLVVFFLVQSICDTSFAQPLNNFGRVANVAECVWSVWLGSKSLMSLACCVEDQPFEPFVHCFVCSVACAPLMKTVLVMAVS